MISSTPTDIFTSLNPGQTAEASRSRNISDMGSDDFMALMIAQMKHQDPTKPMDQMAFMSQLAEFSSLSGIQELNGADTVTLLSATVDMGEGSDGGVFDVRDNAGNLVFSGQLPAGSGHVPVVWDGQASDGSYLQPGDYNISARVERGGDLRDARVYGHDTVISVAIGSGNQVT